MPNEGSYDWWRANYATDARYLKVASVLTGVDCSQVEVDHFPPNASYTGTLYDSRVSYGGRPAFPLPKYLHRYKKGDGGMGGHASTTGSTFVQVGWTGELTMLMAAGKYFEAMRQDIFDKQNVAYYASGNRHLFDELMAPAVKLAVHLGLITETEGYSLLFSAMRLG